MTEVVLDASAVLAYLFGEPGADAVAAVLLRAIVSPVNVAEVIGKLIDRGFSADDAAAAFGRLGCEVAPVDAAMGREAGMLHEKTRGRGVSLGDRFCLSLSARMAFRPCQPIEPGNRSTSAWRFR